MIEKDIAQGVKAGLSGLQDYSKKKDVDMDEKNIVIFARYLKTKHITKIEKQPLWEELLSTVRLEN